ncbi:MAG TPA: DUF2188 domain-containing protein [Gemmatimonadaceae bacterium]|nr:DUF2188 domain-containing protein [Gemmatimonadaceae bacterium]
MPADGEGRQGWCNKQDGEILSRHRLKEVAVAAGRALARQFQGEHTIHNEDGEIAGKNSYGNDRVRRGLTRGELLLRGGRVQQEQQGGEVSGRPRGMQALAGAAIAIIGVLAAANPTSALLKALAEAVPQLAATLPTVITACGAIVTALSQPPELGGRRSK